MGLTQLGKDAFNAGADSDSASEAIDAGMAEGELSLAGTGRTGMATAAGALRQRMNASTGLVDRLLGAAFAFVIAIIMLNFLFGLEIVSNSDGPFSDQMDTVQQVIGAALILGVLGILAMAGYYARSMLGGR